MAAVALIKVASDRMATAGRGTSTDQTGERPDDAQSDQHVVVAARHGMEEHHRVQPERHDREGRCDGGHTRRVVSRISATVARLAATAT